MEIKRCAHCMRDLKNETTYISSLYSPQHTFELCLKCGDYEEKKIEEAGTNDLPWLLAFYYHYPH